MYKTLHRKLTIEQHELHKQRGVILGAHILLYPIPVFILYWQLNFEWSCIYVVGELRF
jgi:hypothetical protein